MNLKIITHSSGEHSTQVDVFNAVELNEQLNNNSINTVMIGGLIFSRIDVKAVVPFVETIAE